MVRRFVLLGLAQTPLFERGTLTQIVFATLFCMGYMVIELQADPFVSSVDRWCGLASSLCLSMLFIYADIDYTKRLADRLFQDTSTTNVASKHSNS